MTATTIHRNRITTLTDQARAQTAAQRVCLHAASSIWQVCHLPNWFGNSGHTPTEKAVLDNEYIAGRVPHGLPAQTNQRMNAELAE